MKISNKIKNPLLSIETILVNGLKVSRKQGNMYVAISKQDTYRILDWLEELQDNEIKNLSKIEDILTGKGCYLLDK